MPIHDAFSLGGIRVHFVRSWSIAFLLFAWSLSVGYFPLQAPNYSPVIYWIFGIVSTLGLFGSVLFHELSHCVAAKSIGVRVRRITLFVFGGFSEMEQTHSRSPGTEFRITIAGPLASLVLGMFFWSTSTLMQPVAPRIITEVFHYLFYVNFLLAAFNLIPGFPLDGGRILRSYLWHRSGDLKDATRTAAGAGRLFAAIVIGLGILALLKVHFIAGIWLILIGSFLKKSAENELKAFEMRAELENLTIRQIMSPAVALDSSTSIAAFVNDYVFHYHQRVFPVETNGRFAGMIDVRAAKKIPTEEWPRALVRDHLIDPATYSVLHPDHDAEEALRLLTNDRRSEAPVVCDDALVGTLTRDELFKFLALKSDLAA